MSKTLLANGRTWDDVDNWDEDTQPDFSLPIDEPPVDELEALFL